MKSEMAKNCISFLILFFLVLMMAGCVPRQESATMKYEECLQDCLSRSDYPANEKCPKACEEKTGYK